MKGPAIHQTSQLAGPGIGIWAHQNAVYSTVRGYDVVAPDHNAHDLNATTVTAIQGAVVP